VVTVTSNSAAVNDAITQAAATTKPMKINVPEVPGVTAPIQSNNWSKQEPVVKNPSGQEISIKTTYKNKEAIVVGMNPDGSPIYEVQ
jgi:hypothetical protein